MRLLQNDRQTMEQLARAATEGVLQSLGKWLIIALIALAIFSAVREHWRMDYDATDNKVAGERSNMHLLTDYGTGCQYLSTREGGITPRLGADGRQVCN